MSLQLLRIAQLVSLVSICFPETPGSGCTSPNPEQEDSSQVVLWNNCPVSSAQALHIPGLVTRQCVNRAAGRNQDPVNSALCSRVKLSCHPLRAHPPSRGSSSLVQCSLIHLFIQFSCSIVFLWLTSNYLNPFLVWESQPFNSSAVTIHLPLSRVSWLVR